MYVFRALSLKIVILTVVTLSFAFCYHHKKLKKSPKLLIPIKKSRLNINFNV